MKKIHRFNSFINEKEYVKPYGVIYVDGKKIFLDTVVYSDDGATIVDLYVNKRSIPVLKKLGIARDGDQDDIDNISIEQISSDNNRSSFKTKIGQKFTAKEFVKYANWNGPAGIELLPKKKVNESKFNSDELKNLVYQALNNAIENEFDEVLTNNSRQVAMDILDNDGGIQDYLEDFMDDDGLESFIEPVKKFVEDWRVLGPVKESIGSDNRNIGEISINDDEGNPIKYSILWNDLTKQVEIYTTGGIPGVIAKGKNIHLAMLDFGKYCQTFIQG